MKVSYNKKKVQLLPLNKKVLFQKNLFVNDMFHTLLKTRTFGMFIILKIPHLLYFILNYF